MRTIRTVFTIVLLVVLTPLAVAADNPKLVVRDAAGTLVGTVLPQTIDIAVTEGLTDRVPLWVAKRIPGSWIFLPVSQSAVWTTKDLTSFLYENSDCTGPQLLEAPKTSNEVRLTVLFDTQVYWPAGTGWEREIRSRRVLTADPESCDGMLLEGNLCCTVVRDTETSFAAEAVGVSLAALGLRPPFRLERAPAQPAR